MQPTSYVQFPSQKVQRARPSWLSLGSPATTLGKIEDEECSEEQVDSHIQQRSSSPPRLRKSVPTTHSSPSPVRPGSPVPTRAYSPRPVRPGLADITNMQTSTYAEEKLYLQEHIDDLKKRVTEYEREQLSAYVAPHYHPYRAQGPPLPMSWAASPSPYGSFFPSPFGFYPPFIAASPFETPRTTMPTSSELNDEVDFDTVFSNYGNQSPLRIRRNIIEECWRKACSHSNFGVLLVKKAYSERERAASNCTGDHRYGKKALSPKCLTAVKEAIASVQPPQPGQKKEDWWKTYKDAINSSCRSITRGQRTRPYLF